MIKFPSVFEGISDLNKDQIVELLSLSKEFKNLHNEGHHTLYDSFRRYTVACSFLENSTRTKHSFEMAIKHLGANYMDFNAEKSSLSKGESIEETLLTLYCQGVQAVVLRTSISNLLEDFKSLPPIKIINGGDGTNEHPTQALLDLFTMIELGIDLEGKTVGIVGDCVHSRVTHSLCKLLPQFGAKIILCGPEAFLPKEKLENKNITLSNDISETVLNSDLLYLLRIQKERHLDPSHSNLFEKYHENFGINERRLNDLGKDIPIFHPGPFNLGVELSSDIIRHKRYKAYEQVKNSVFVRMAIIKQILENGEKKIGHNANLAAI